MKTLSGAPIRKLSWSQPGFLFLVAETKRVRGSAPLYRVLEWHLVKVEAGGGYRTVYAQGRPPGSLRVGHALSRRATLRTNSNVTLKRHHCATQGIKAASYPESANQSKGSDSIDPIDRPDWLS